MDIIDHTLKGTVRQLFLLNAHLKEFNTNKPLATNYNQHFHVDVYLRMWSKNGRL